MAVQAANTATTVDFPDCREQLSSILWARLRRTRACQSSGTRPAARQKTAGSRAIARSVAGLGKTRCIPTLTPFTYSQVSFVRCLQLDERCRDGHPRLDVGPRRLQQHFAHHYPLRTHYDVHHGLVVDLAPDLRLQLQAFAASLTLASAVRSSMARSAFASGARVFLCSIPNRSSSRPALPTSAACVASAAFIRCSGRCTPACRCTAIRPTPNWHATARNGVRDCSGERRVLHLHTGHSVRSTRGSLSCSSGALRP